MSIHDDEGAWTCPDCRQENLPQARYCEVCGKRRGASEPGPGPAVMARLRGARASEPSADEGDEAGGRVGRRVKLRFLDFGERIRAMFRRPEGGRRRARDGGGPPVLALLVAFAIWMLVRMVGYYPLVLLLKFVMFLFTPLGLPVWLFLAWYYSRNRRTIHRVVESLRQRLMMFARMATKVAESMQLLGGGMRNLLQNGREEAFGDERPGRSRASVRILEQEWDDDEDDGIDEPPPRRRR